MNTKPYRFHTKPRPYQKAVLKRSKDLETRLFAMDMGTGKTKTTIDNACYLHHHQQIQLFVIVAPKGMYHQWLEDQYDEDGETIVEPSEWRVHSPIKDAHLYTWTSNDSKKEKVLKDKLFKLKESGKLVVVCYNTEAISSSKKAVDHLTKLLKTYPDNLVAIDEASILANHKNRVSKVLFKLLPYMKYRRLLTGQPIRRSPLDAFGLFKIVDPNVFGINYFTFRARYAVLKKQHVGQRSFDVVVGYKNQDELREKIAPYIERVILREVVDELPPVVHEQYKFELTKDQKRMYEVMKEECITFLNEQDRITATTALTQLLKLRQIACGFITEQVDGGSTEHGIVPFDSNPRLEALVNVLVGMDGKVIIWCNFRRCVREIEMALAKEFPDEGVVTYVGGMSKEERLDAQYRFNKTDEVRFFVGTPQTGKYGLNLVAPNNMVFYTTDFDLDARRQAERRMERIGQKNNMLIVDIVANETLEYKILRCLRNKQKFADTLIDGGWRGWLK